LAPEPAPPSRDGRIITIDVLRGLAILWVMTFHLYADMIQRADAEPRHLYPALRDRLAEGAPLHALTALAEVIMSMGYQGVPLFMILSGLSLTLSAGRRPEAPLLRGYLERGRRLLVPYWTATMLTVTTIATIALLQMLIHGGSYHDHWFGVKLARTVAVNTRLDDVLYTLSVFGWLFRDKPVTIAVGSLWFVQMLVVYYLVFPFALRLLNKLGPWRFLLLGLAFTLVARSWFIFFPPHWIDPLSRIRLLYVFPLFRASEFFMGMSLGYLLVHHRAQVAEWVRSPFDIAGIVVMALLLQMFGAMLKTETDLLTVLGDPAIQIAMVLFIVPVLFKAPGRLEVSAFAAVMAFVGTVAYAALIVNDQMRYIASFLRQEELPRAAWWFFLVVIYIPAGTLLAYPLAKVLGLLPGRTPAAPAPQIDQASVLQAQPAAGP
jgi:peptidoglycan/LPS O-acetylase OafA/YrhL